MPVGTEMTAAQVLERAEAGESEPGELDVVVTTTDYVRFPWDRDLEIIPPAELRLDDID